MLISEQPNDMIYQVLHKKLLAQLSRRERQNNELIFSNDNNILQQYQQQNKSNNSNQSKITVHFTFESDPMLQFKRELRRL